MADPRRVIIEDGKAFGAHRIRVEGFHLSPLYDLQVAASEQLTPTDCLSSFA
jgi:hypothetical protein